MKPRIVVMALLGLFVLISVAGADDAADKAQYEALAKSRADAELAVRQAGDFFMSAEKTWRETAQAIDADRASQDDALAKVIDREQKKAEDLRDQKAIDAAEQSRHELEARWQAYGTSSRPGLEQDFHQADNQSAAAGQLLRSLEEVEPQLKDARGDLAPLGALYDEAAASAKSSLDAGTTALEGMKKIQRDWQPTTQPSGN